MSSELATFDDHGGIVDELGAQGFKTPAQAQEIARQKRVEGEVDNLPVSQYGALAFDLAMQIATVPQILEVYNLTEAGLEALIDQPSFRDAVRDAKGQLNEHGPVSNFVVRSRFIAEDLLDDVYKLAKSPTTDAPLRFKIFESMTRHARIDPAVTKQKGEQGAGVSVVFNLSPGIGGLQHVMPSVVVQQ